MWKRGTELPCPSARPSPRSAQPTTGKSRWPCSCSHDALLAGGEVEVRLGPLARPEVLVPVELGRTHPVLRRELEAVLDAHPALLRAVDEEEPAEAPEGLAAEGLLALLVDEHDPLAARRRARRWRRVRPGRLPRRRRRLPWLRACHQPARRAPRLICSRRICPWQSGIPRSVPARPRWLDDRLTHPSRARRPAVDAAAPPADHRPRGGGRRPDRQPDHGPAAPALGPRPALRHQPLRQQPRRLRHRRSRHLRHDARHPQRRLHSRSGIRGLHGPVPPRRGHARQALRPAQRADHDAPAVRRHPGHRRRRRGPGREPQGGQAPGQRAAGASTRARPSSRSPTTASATAGSVRRRRRHTASSTTSSAR